MGKTIIFETKNFQLLTFDKPHIPREDGGHIAITTKEYYCDRTAFTPEIAQEFILFSMLAGEAYKAAMKAGGVEIGRINYQENGNWAFRNGSTYPPFFHLHLYGRTENSKTQKWGQALVFPDPDTGYYDNFSKLTEEDYDRIRQEIRRLLKEEKYSGIALE